MNTAAFLAKITPQAKNLILVSVAHQYGITEEEAYKEVTDRDAEHLLDYLGGASRIATSLLMQKHGFA